MCVHVATMCVHKGERYTQISLHAIDKHFLHVDTMQAEVPLKTSYKDQTGYDATATSVPLLVTAEKEAEEEGISKETPPDNYRSRSLAALCCFCPVGVKALSQSFTVRIMQLTVVII